MGLEKGEARSRRASNITRWCCSSEAEHLSLLFPFDRQVSEAQQRSGREFYRLATIEDRRDNVRREKIEPSQSNRLPPGVSGRFSRSQFLVGDSVSSARVRNMASFDAKSCRSHSFARKRKLVGLLQSHAALISPSYFAEEVPSLNGADMIKAMLLASTPYEIEWHEL